VQSGPPWILGQAHFLVRACCQLHNVSLILSCRELMTLFGVAAVYDLRLILRISEWSTGPPSWMKTDNVVRNPRPLHILADNVSCKLLAVSHRYRIAKETFLFHHADRQIHFELWQDFLDLEECINGLHITLAKVNVNVHAMFKSDKKLSEAARDVVNHMLR
jgi:hypothetical protein